MRIIHLTDFHLNKKTKKDWDTFLKNALIQKLKSIHEDKSISLLAFTGDFIDMGGQDFDNPKDAFELFEKDIILPILDELGLEKNRFYFVPGNHDVVRKKDLSSEIAEIGLRGFFDKRENLSKFIDENKNLDENFENLGRIKDFKQFEVAFYKDISLEKFQTKFSSSFKFKDNFSNLEIGIVCLNSSWRSYGNDDKGNLLIGDGHLAEHYDFVKNQDIKICLIHHPLDSLSEVEQKTIIAHIQKYFNIMLLGHCHEAETIYRGGISQTLFQNMAPSGINDILSDSRTYSNGFSLIDFDNINQKVQVEHWRYNHNKLHFTKNTDLGDENGKIEYLIPKVESLKQVSDAKLCLNHIVENHFPLMDEHMIEIKTSNGLIQSLKEHYILPPITSALKRSSGEENNMTLSEVLGSKWNSIFFGNGESGKTILLYKLIHEFVNEHDTLQKIPVYVDFENLGSKEIKTVIKEYLNLSTNQVNYFLESKKIVLLIDNLNYSKFAMFKDRFNKVFRFVQENQEIRIIASSEGSVNGIDPIDFLNHNEIPFEKFFIKNLGVKEIKNVMKLWVPNAENLDLTQKLDKLVSDFQSFSLPSTAMAVSLFLWSTEYHDTKPINQSVLLEIYMDIILQKLDKSNIYRDSFDFKNKQQTIAKIAQEMLTAEGEDYSILYSKYVEVIEGYIKTEVGFDFDSSVIAEYFIERKIFKKVGNKVKFTYSCYFHYFLAKRMADKREFRNFVLSENEYCKFIKEIDYYTGLVRSDEELFDEIYNRFLQEFKRTDFIFEGMNSKWDKHFMITLNKKEGQKEEFIPTAKSISITKIKENRPSEELMEDLNDRRLASISDPHKILRKEGSVNLEALLILLANVLRNSEGVENMDLKKNAYGALVKYSMIWTVIYREYLIDYVIKYKNLPPSFPIEYNLINVLKNLPLLVQGGMFKHCGTTKLSPIVLEKINDDLNNRSVTKSDMELFMSVAFYADIQGRDFPKYVRKLINKMKISPVQDYLLYKLLYFFHTRTREGSDNEEMYLDLISALRIKNQRLPVRAKESIKRTIKESRRKILK